jgi:hypothetical protein
MPSVPVDGATAEGRWNLVASVSCPECGSFLDAPRIEPVTGELARKCLSCREWHPVARRFSPKPASDEARD